MSRRKDSTCPCPRCGVNQVAPGQSYCRECRKAYNRDWFREERRCSRCGIAEASQNHCYCEKCLTEHGREWRRAHPRPPAPPRLPKPPKPFWSSRVRTWRDKFKEKVRQCPQCGVAPVVRGGSYCRACHAAQTLERYHANGGHAGLSERTRRLSNVRSTARRARRLGKLQPETCECCGTAKVEMHHDDYTQPLQVRWLCKRCHVDLHMLE